MSGDPRHGAAVRLRRGVVERREGGEGEAVWKEEGVQRAELDEAVGQRLEGLTAGAVDWAGRRVACLRL